jgi:putative RecB family exonuclease
MYSNSRIQTFEQCPRKYKFRYVDNLRMDTEGVEAFVGKRVHEALEKLYRDLKYAKLNPVEDILAFYESEWEKNWTGKVQVANKNFTPGNYFALGQQCIRDYYKHYHPFTQGKTVGLEERLEFKLKDGDKSYSLLGFVDRLTWVPETETYEIHDYKTGNHVPTQKEADQDRQLALYHLGLLQRWPDAKNVKLIWHYLASDKEIVSSRQLSDLEALEKEVVEVIHQIERESQLGRWDVRMSALCGWCEYKPLCPAFRHPIEMAALPTNEYLQNSGVQLVQTYVAFEEQKADHLAEIKKIEAEQKKVEDALIDFAQKESVSVVDGPNHRIVFKTEDEFKVPRKGEDPFAWELLRTTLKNAKKLEDVSTVNGAMLKWALKRGSWPPDLTKSIMGLITQSIKKTVSLVKK